MDEKIIQKLVSPEECWRCVEEVLDHDHFRFEEIAKFNTRWWAIYSARNDGKSVTVDIDCALSDYFLTGRQLLYLRRRRKEAKASKVEAYFANDRIFAFIQKISPLAFPLFDIYKIEAKTGKIQLYGVNSNVKTLLGTIGFYSALDSYEEDKSNAAGANVYSVIYEEFLAPSSEGKELEDEFERLLNSITTYTRDRDFRVYCIGNTVRRRSKVFEGFGVDPDEIPLGIAKTFFYKTKNGEENTLCVYHIPETKSRKRTVKSYFFGDKNRTNLIGDEWYTADFPPIPKEYGSDLFKPKLALRIINGQITLYLYFTPDGKIICTVSRWVSFCNYITIGEKTDLQRGWISKDGAINIINTIRTFVSHGFVFYENNYAGDDLLTFLEK